MADDAANQTPATATVIRVTDKQVRLRLDEANGGREVTKRVAVPEEARERLDGTTVPVVLHGTGARARVELADDWLTPAKPKRSRSRGGSKAKPKADAAEAPPVGAAPADEAAAKPKRRRTRGAAAAEPDAAPTAEAITEAAPAEEAAPKPKRGSRRRRSGGASDDAPKAEAAAVEPATPEAQPAPAAAAPAPRDEAEVRERIAAAVELVRVARQPVAR